MVSLLIVDLARLFAEDPAQTHCKQLLCGRNSPPNGTAVALGIAKNQSISAVRSLGGLESRGNR